MSAPKDDRALLDALCRRLSCSTPSVGEVSGKLASGDLVAEIIVRISRRVEYGEAAQLVERAIAALAGLRYYTERCDQQTSRKTRWGGTGWCCKPISHAVLWSDKHVTFVCSTHAEKMRFRDVQVVALPKYRLAEVKKVLDVKVAARRREEAGVGGVVGFLHALAAWRKREEDDNDLARARQKRGISK